MNPEKIAESFMDLVARDLQDQPEAQAKALAIKKKEGPKESFEEKMDRRHAEEEAARKARGEYRFGDCLVPNGKKGLWTVDTFEVKRDLGMFMQNFRNVRDGYGFMNVNPGTYKWLHHKKHGIVMSNTPMEIQTNRLPYIMAKGSVLINGLGLGMLLEGLLHKPDVTHIKVIEIDSDLIKLVGKHFKDPRVEIVQADAHAYQPAKDERYDYIWHDIWNTLSSKNFKDMAKLTRKWAGRAGAQGVWSRDEVRAAERRS